MVDRKDQANGGVWPETSAHEEFRELCALATAGSLSPEEQARLREHLASCAPCRKVLEEFEGVVDHMIPALAPQLASETPEADPAFNEGAAEASFFNRLARENKTPLGPLEGEETWHSPLVVQRSRNLRRSFERYHIWLPLAAGLLLCTSLGILTYRIGKHHGINVTEQVLKAASGGAAKPSGGLEAVARDAAVAQLSERDRIISELRKVVARQTNEDDRLRAQQAELGAALQVDAGEKKQLTGERDRLAQQVAASQAALEASETKLNRFEKERAEDAMHATTLEARVVELSHVVADQKRSLSEDEDLLAKDRDIRELMGARDLYITEVYDVARTGETEKAFGRVFYTKGKSLIFYAYDLGEQPGLKNGSAFQAWGRRGPDWTEAFSLGMFYEDNASKKRWVVKFNDKKALEKIDAVFVTVEPRGGSERPTGKPLLFAYLKVDANHP